MPRPSGTRAETLDYLRVMLAQLRAIADRERCEMLAYLIDMAHVEAADVLRREVASAAHSHDGGRTQASAHEK